MSSAPAEPLPILPYATDGSHPYMPHKPSLEPTPPRTAHRVVAMSTLRGRPTLYSRPTPSRHAPRLPSSGSRQSPRLSLPEDAISTSSDASSEQEPSKRLQMTSKVLALPAVFSTPAPILPKHHLPDPTKPQELSRPTGLPSTISRVDELSSRVDDLSSMGATWVHGYIGASRARHTPPQLHGHPAGVHARQAPPMLYGLPAVRRAPTILPPLQKRIHLPCGQPTSHRQPPTTYLRASIPSATPPRRDAHGGYPGSA